MQNKETYWQEGVWKTVPWPGCREKADNVGENPGLWGRSICRGEPGTRQRHQQLSLLLCYGRLRSQVSWGPQFPAL